MPFCKQAQLQLAGQLRIACQPALNRGRYALVRRPRQRCLHGAGSRRDSQRVLRRDQVRKFGEHAGRNGEHRKRRRPLQHPATSRRVVWRCWVECEASVRWPVAVGVITSSDRGIASELQPHAGRFEVAAVNRPFSADQSGAREFERSLVEVHTFQTNSPQREQRRKFARQQIRYSSYATSSSGNASFNLATPFLLTAVSRSSSFLSDLHGLQILKAVVGHARFG